METTSGDAWGLLAVPYWEAGTGVSQAKRASIPNLKVSLTGSPSS